MRILKKEKKLIRVPAASDQTLMSANFEMSGFI